MVRSFPVWEVEGELVTFGATDHKRAGMTRTHIMNFDHIAYRGLRERVGGRWKVDNLDRERGHSECKFEFEC